MQNEKIEQVRALLENAIETFRAAGGRVGNSKMVDRFDGLVPYYRGDLRCLLGAVLADHPYRGGFEHDVVGRLLGISKVETRFLEAGFEDWPESNTLSWQRTPNNKLYYDLGREIGQRLEKEETPTSSGECA